MQRGDAGVERAQLAPGRRRRCARTRAAWAGSAAASASRDLAHRGLGVARVVPPVRVVARRPRRRSSRPAARSGTDRAEVDDLGVAAAVGDDLVDPGVEVVAAGEDERRRSAAASTSLGPRLVLVRVGVRLQDLVDRRPRRRRPRARSRRPGSSSRRPRACRRRSPLARSRRSRRRAGPARASAAATARPRGARASARAGGDEREDGAGDARRSSRPAARWS